MNRAWIEESDTRLKALEEALEQHGANQAVVQYGDVALAFPSPDPHPNSFSYPMIDDSSLNLWAKSKGWRFRFAPEVAAEGQSHSFPILFTRT